MDFSDTHGGFVPEMEHSRRHKRRPTSARRRLGTQQKLRALSTKDASLSTLEQKLREQTAFERQFARDTWARRAHSAEPPSPARWSQEPPTVAQGRRKLKELVNANDALKAKVGALTVQLESAERAGSTHDAKLAQAGVRAQNLETDLTAVRKTVRAVRLSQIEMARQVSGLCTTIL